MLGRPWETLDVLAGYYELGLDSSSLLEIVQDINKRRVRTSRPLFSLNIQI